VIDLFSELQVSNSFGYPEAVIVIVECEI